MVDSNGPTNKMTDPKNQNFGKFSNCDDLHVINIRYIYSVFNYFKTSSLLEFVSAPKISTFRLVVVHLLKHFLMKK